MLRDLSVIRLVAVWLALCSFFGEIRPVAAQEKDQKPLIWGADQEGGGPFIFPREDDPSVLVGFEVDLVTALSQELGRKIRFRQCQWDQVLPQLDRRDVDLALNGYEFMPERARDYQVTRPYYIYELGLCVRKNSNIRRWEDLRKPGAKRLQIGVLGSSGADTYVTQNFGEMCDVRRYDTTTESLRLLETGQLDASVQDLPMLIFYVEQGRQHPDLMITDVPEGKGFYVVYVRKQDTDLAKQIDAAIEKLFERGELRRIYEKYHIWNDRQLDLKQVFKTWGPIEQVEVDRWTQVMLYLPKFRRAALMTALLAIFSMPLAVIIGLAMALIRSWYNPTLGGAGAQAGWTLRLIQFPATLYVEVVRGTPLAFQLFVVYFLLPSLLRWIAPDNEINISPFWSAVIALAINYSAYEAEIFRLGLQAIPRGQMEACQALGMSRPLALRRVILPQAVRVVLPATANDFIALFKDTAVCSVIAVEELSKQYSLAAKSTNLFLEMALVASVMYLVMSYPLSLLSARIERYLRR